MPLTGHQKAPDAEQLSDASAPEGAGVEVGARIRQLRRLHRCTLRVVAERTGLTEGFLSQIERGRANPSLSSLQRIAQTLGVELVALFDESWQPQPAVLHKDNRKVVRVTAGVRTTLLTPLPFSDTEVFCGEFAVGGSTGADEAAHGDSEELLIVLSGCMALHLSGAVFAMPDGSSISYRSSLPHRLVNVGDGPAEAMWVVSPPSRRSED